MAEEIICLGKTFISEDERLEYFRNELRKLLPELKKIDGFPLGEDNDIIALSDPPYYTACPNPWLNEFITEWKKEKIRLEANGTRKPTFEINEPFASDVSEGKNNPIYNAHNYHTKVPHPAIMRFLLHYTQPGDIILDGFAGTGMTGVAAQLCNKPDSETKYIIEKEFKEIGLHPPIWGKRNAICGDLSPIASFIAYNYNNPIDAYAYEEETKRILTQIENDLGWMFETKDKYGNTGKINYTVWSDVFLCKECNNEIVFSDVALDNTTGSVASFFNCPNCNAKLTKRMVDNAMMTIFDKELATSFQQKKTVPVLINYSLNGRKYDKVPDENDLILLNNIAKSNITDWFPTGRLPEGDEARRNDVFGYTHIHHFYTKRSLSTLAKLYSMCESTKNRAANLFFVEQATLGMSSLNRYGPTHYSQVNRYLSGTLYVSSLIAEVSPGYILKGKIKRLPKAFNLISNREVITTQSATSFSLIEDNSIDYIFTDPPFGANLMYSELNIFWESWLKIKTDNFKEAIQNKSQGKTLLEYQGLMADCFAEYYRVLKPQKWMTVEFSNTSAAVWNGIQTAIQRSGFVIANVTALDKKQGSFKAVTTPTAVKQDLIISCYKPSDDIVGNLSLQDDKNVWEFIGEHLNHLPIHLKSANKTTIVVERNPKILYDRLVSYYLVRGLQLSIDSKEFQEGLKQRFDERDDMYFTQEQVVEYDEKKANAPNIIQLSWQVATESEGIEWLQRELRVKELKYQDIQPKWMQAITAVRKGDLLPELREILQQNFIEELDGSWRVPNMNEAKDRYLIRNRALLKEFSGYVELANNPKSKKMKEVRVEALRVGFKNCWESKDFGTIVKLSEKIPQNLLLEDEQLLMYYDIARDRV